MVLKNRQSNPRILIIYFSLSGQSRGLINLLAIGMRSEGSQVSIEQLQALEKISFPFKGIIQTIWMMISTFFRVRVPIVKPSTLCFDRYDLIVLAGPTWSYNPSGPILSLLDRYGTQLFKGQNVLPLLSCRGFYKIHDRLLRKQLKTCGAVLEKSLVFSHPAKEPWSTIGVFLKSAGYNPQKTAILKNHYPHFGHTTDQLRQIKESGCKIAQDLRLDQSSEEGISD